MVTFSWTWLATLTTTVSPSLAYKVGPGNRPFTVMMDLVEQSRVKFFATTCMEATKFFATREASTRMVQTLKRVQRRRKGEAVACFFTHEKSQSSCQLRCRPIAMRLRQWSSGK
ncbi:hypothetical protein BHM03_00007555 [Ensete ventricosum]|uniref:Secreted protein n=1 Tax=Ensete ventricosum TaxID=4639 RepID=A0A427B5P2_ENSVE|nr:hypothetical protein B296_00003311 [Ensete ventricosum]RZR81357.1 hypothetical protein BHM03_00007555 [Ensete ventricosum]